MLVWKLKSEILKLTIVIKGYHFHKMRPWQLSWQCRDNLGLRKKRSKWHHSTDILLIESCLICAPPREILRPARKKHYSEAWFLYYELHEIHEFSWSLSSKSFKNLIKNPSKRLLQRSIELSSSSVVTRHSSNKFGYALAAPTVLFQNLSKISSCNELTFYALWGIEKTGREQLAKSLGHVSRK